MSIDKKTYNKWLNLARVICPTKQKAEDTLQEFCLNVLEKKIPFERLNDNYVFISLRNTFLSLSKKESIYSLDEERVKSIQLEEEEEPIDYSDIEARIDERLDLLEEVFNSLHPYEKKLYLLHFMYGISQRAIAKGSGIGHVIIFNRIKKIKEKINERYKKDKEGDQKD